MPLMFHVKHWIDPLFIKGKEKRGVKACPSGYESPTGSSLVADPSKVEKGESRPVGGVSRELPENSRLLHGIPYSQLASMTE